jgi:hypothetical protein
MSALAIRTRSGNGAGGERYPGCLIRGCYGDSASDDVGDGGGHVPGKQVVLEAVEALAAEEADKKDIEIEMLIDCSTASSTVLVMTAEMSDIRSWAATRRRARVWYAQRLEYIDWFL